jgi:exopolysaccharide production protein ExoQ
MSSWLALLTCIFGTAGLLFLDRDKSVGTSKALWLPVIWLWIVGSRPVSVWLGINPGMEDVSQLVEGSPADRLIFEILLIIGILVLARRGRRTAVLLRANWLILIYFAYCLLSVMWSDFPEVALKRWTKSIGDLAMVFIVLTEVDPSAAFRRLLSRVGFVLLPASVLLIKYFGDLGRGYDPDGIPMNTGVTMNKNTLGVITFVIALGALWRVRMLIAAKEEPSRGQHLLAQGTLLAVGVVLLATAHSATSSACFALGAGLMLASSLPLVRRRSAGVHALVLSVFLMGGLAMFIGAQADVVHALGRETTLTGRTEIWQAVLPFVPNSAVGAGFESFWLGPRLDRVWSRLSAYMHVNEAHNGYLEVYLNLGWVGVGLIGLILVKGYSNVVTAFRYDPPVGSLLLAYVVAAAFYSISEAGFRLLNPIWIFLLLAVVAAGGVSRGIGTLRTSGATGPEPRLDVPR